MPYFEVYVVHAQKHLRYATSLHVPIILLLFIKNIVLLYY